MFGVLESVMKTEEKVIEYTMSSLRSASEVYKQGGNVTMKHRDQLFRLHYDNRRVLDWETTIPPGVEMLIDSQPIEGVKVGKSLRFISSLSKKNQFMRYNVSKVQSKYKDEGEIAIRKFIKAVVSTPPQFNIPPASFSSNRSLLAFVKEYNPAYKVSLEVISRYKRRGVKLGKIKRTKDALKFTSYVKSVIPSFNESQFYLTE